MASNCKYLPAQMRHRLTLQSSSRVSDGQGGWTESWDDEADLWASIEPVKGYERFQAMQTQVPVMHRVVLRYRSAGVTTAKRLLFGERVFGIKEVINEGEASLWLRLICIEQTN